MVIHKLDNHKSDADSIIQNEIRIILVRLSSSSDNWIWTEYNKHVIYSCLNWQLIRNVLFFFEEIQNLNWSAIINHQIYSYSENYPTDKGNKKLFISIWINYPKTQLFVLLSLYSGWLKIYFQVLNLGMISRHQSFNSIMCLLIKFYPVSFPLEQTLLANKENTWKALLLHHNFNQIC